MSKLQSHTDLIGKSFNRLTILEISGTNERRERLVIAKCECGIVKEIKLRTILDGRTKSCGCYLKQKLKEPRPYKETHGLTKHPLYKVWAGMKRRCYNTHDRYYNDYGGRGILVCDEWLHNPEVFIEWGLSNGYEKGLHIDRIENDKSYSPDNCRFITPTVNQRNTRASVYLDYKGQKKTIAEWGEVLGINRQLIWQRIKRDGLTIEQALSK